VRALHPLAHRLLGKDLIDQQRGTFGHAPRPAAGAEPAAFAAEHHRMIGVASVATHPQEPVFQTPASEIVLEFPLHVGPKARVNPPSCGHVEFSPQTWNPPSIPEQAPSRSLEKETSA